MNVEERSPNENTIDYLIRTRRFSDCMILAWGFVEDMVNQIVVQEFKLNYGPKKTDLKVDLLLTLEFYKKLKFTKDSNRISSEDYEVINKFNEERNKLFHGYMFKPDVVSLPESEKTRLMKLAKQAGEIIIKRGFGVKD